MLDELRALCRQQAPARQARIAALLARLERSHVEGEETERRLSLLEEMGSLPHRDGQFSGIVWEQMPPEARAPGARHLLRNQVDPADLTMLRVALTAVTLRDIQGQAGHVSLRARMFNTAVALWNDHQAGRVRLTVPERLAVANALTDAFTAITPIRPHAADLRHKVMGEEDVQAAVRHLPEPGWTPPSMKLIDLAQARVEPRGQAAEIESQASEFVQVDHVRMRLKDSKYGQYRLKKEQFKAMRIIMNGQAAPFSKLAEGGAPLFPQAMAKRWDRARLGHDPGRLVVYASPLVDGYQDLGQLTRDWRMPDIIEADRGPEALRRYMAARERFEKAEDAQTARRPLYPRHPDEARQVEDEEIRRAGEKGEPARLRNHEVTAQRRELHDMREVLLGRPDARSRQQAMERLRPSWEKDKASRPVPRPHPNQHIEQEWQARDALWKMVLPLEAAENALGNLGAGANELTIHQVLAAGRHLEELDLIGDRREIESVKSNAVGTMIDQFPTYLQHQMIAANVNDEGIHNDDRHNLARANRGFAAIGEPRDWTYVGVDFGNAGDPGFGGAETKAESEHLGHTRARVEDPNTPNEVSKDDLDPVSISLTSTALGSRQRSLPTAMVVLPALRAETAAASDGVSQDATWFSNKDAMNARIEATFRELCVPDEAYERLAATDWPGGADGLGWPDFRKVSGNPSRTASEEAGNEIVRRDKLVGKVGLPAIARWKRGNPERAVQVFAEVAAGVQAVTDLHIDHRAEEVLADTPSSAGSIGARAR